MSVNIDFPHYVTSHSEGDGATYPLARPDERLAVSLLLAGMSLPRRRFVPATRPNIPSGTPNYGF